MYHPLCWWRGLNWTRGISGQLKTSRKQLATTQEPFIVSHNNIEETSNFTYVCLKAQPNTLNKLTVDWADRVAYFATIWEVSLNTYLGTKPNQVEKCLVQIVPVQFVTVVGHQEGQHSPGEGISTATNWLEAFFFFKSIRNYFVPKVQKGDNT